MAGPMVFHRDEVDLIAAFAGCSLDESPGSNWVQKAGGLPDYICRIARAIKRTGKTTSEAIAIAVDRVKVWASGKGVDKDTQAKAAAAVAEWEEKRAKAHAKSDAKVAASHVRPGADDYVEVSVAGADISDAELRALMAQAGPCPRGPVQTILALSAPDRTRSALQLLLASDPDKDGDDDSSASGDSDADYANTKASSYADPGYQSDRKKRYALDTAAQVRAAWSYINQKDNAGKYAPGDLAKVKANIKRAGAKHGIDFAED